MPWVYMLSCGDGTLYTGWTTDPARRLRMHRIGKGSRYTRARQPLEMVYLEECATKEEAMSREWHIKRLTRAEKDRMICACPAEKIRAVLENGEDRT